MRTIFIFLFLLHEVTSRCADHSFIGCMLRLKTQRVPIEKNILTLIFNIGTEARLLHTCKVYSATLPCFQDKIRDCGDDKQKRVLNEVSKTIMYLCSPFSLQRQRAVIKHQKCISAVLSLPASTGCNLNEHTYGRQVMECKKECSNKGSDFICMMRTWISEQNTCTLRDIEQKCGEEASGLFQELQTTVFEPSFPVVCSFSNQTQSVSTPKPNSERKVATFKKDKTRRKPARKSKTEIQEFPLVLTSTPASTVNNIYIEIPKKEIQPTIYMRPQKPMSPETQNFTISEVEKTNIWKKVQNNQKVQYNKEVWRQKTAPGDFVFSTQHPLFTTTEAGVTPRRHKVIDILKSLIPANLPSQLTALLENTYDNKETFSETQSFNTPSESVPATFPAEVITISPETFPAEVITITPATSMIPPKQEIQVQKITYRPEVSTKVTVYYPPATVAPIVQPKWKPWYLSGS